MAQHVRVSGAADDRGALGDRRVLGELYQSFDDEGERAIIEKVAAGGDRVVIGVHSWGRGKASGVPVDVRWAIAFQFRDGKVSRIDVRGDYTEAVRAAGLEA